MPERWIDWLTGHHIVSRARGGNYTKDNCYICHITCHDEITRGNIDASIYKTRQEWLDRNKIKGEENEFLRLSPKRFTSKMLGLRNGD